MTKIQLENYIYLCGEVAELQREKQSLEKKLEAHITDTVQGSSSAFPYTKHPITISGIDVNVKEVLEKKIAEISKLESQLSLQVSQIAQWIDTIQESRIRRLMRYKYIEHKSWVKIAVLLNYDSPDAARMAHNRFIEKNF